MRVLSGFFYADSPAPKDLSVLCRITRGLFLTPIRTKNTGSVNQNLKMRWLNVSLVALPLLPSLLISLSISNDATRTKIAYNVCIAVIGFFLTVRIVPFLLVSF